MNEQEIFEGLVKMTMTSLKITRKQAECRIRAIVKSGILQQFGQPDKEPFQIAIEAAMRIPQLSNENE